MTGFCGNGNEHSSLIKCMEFLDQHDVLLASEDRAAWSLGTGDPSCGKRRVVAHTSLLAQTDCTDCLFVIRRVSVISLK